MGALTSDAHAKRRNKKNKKRDVLDEIGERMGKGETEEVRGRKSEGKGESTKTARGDTVRVKGLF
jgi:hypothetical protein